MQDWNSNSLLTTRERLELYKTIINRVKSADRFKSDYVESIENDDKKAELDAKATEYFAEIGAAYLSPDYHLLPEADKLLVHDFIAKVDPNFDRAKALQARRQLVGEKPPVVMSLEEIRKNRVLFLENFFTGRAREIYRKQSIKKNVKDTEEWIDKQIPHWRMIEMKKVDKFVSEEHARQVKELNKWKEAEQ